MKRLRGSLDRGRFSSPKSAISRVRLIALVVFSFLSFASCGLFAYKRPFDDAYYENNFIAGIDFDDFALPPALGADPVIGQWDFSYRYYGWDTIIEYMTLSQMTGIYATAGGSGFGSPPSGLSPTAPVYALELVNMIDDGDFETDEGTWTPTTQTTWLLSGSGINGRSMQLSLTGGNTTSYSLVPFSSMIQTGSQYSIDFRWTGDLINSWTPTVYLKMNGTGDNFSVNLTSHHAYASFTATGSDVMVCNLTDVACVIDDITVKKAADHRLRLLLRPIDTDPYLEDFLYIFSVWVRTDPTVILYESPYDLDRLAINMKFVDGNSFLSQQPDPDYQYSAASSGWRKISVRLNNGNLQIFPFINRSQDAVLELSIDLNSSLPGRVLIAQPELRAYPDGY